MISARRQFLDAFLGALGAEIVECLERGSEVRGTVRFAEDSEVMDLSGDEGEDLQDFVWSVREEEAPSLLAYRIAEILSRYQLVEIDRLRVSREALLSFLRNEYPDEPAGDGEFDEALAELLTIEVVMVEDGEETADVFRLRE